MSLPLSCHSTRSTDLLQQLLSLLQRPRAVMVGEVHVSEACVAVTRRQAALTIETKVSPKVQDLESGPEQLVRNVTADAGRP